MMSSRTLAPRLLCALAACAAAAGPISAGPIEVLYTTIPGHPTSAVPGMSGLSFNPGVTTQFDRPYASPSGQRWIMRARLGPPATNEDNEIVLVGWGRLGTAVLREGSTQGLLPGEAYGAIGRSMGINDAGRFVFSSRVTTTTAARDVVMMWDGSAFRPVAREGGPAPSTGGGLFAAPLDSAGILNDGAGTPYFRAGGIVAGSRPGQSIWYRGQEVLAATADPELAPFGQLNDPSADWGSLEPGRFHMDALGTNWIGMGVLMPPVGAQAIVVGNGVVAQQATVLPGDPLGRTVAASPGAAIDECISPDGRHWMARGTFTNLQDFVVRDGVLVAATSARITLNRAETERFGEETFPPTFFLNLCNNRGDYLVGGVTDAADTGANAVVVLNRQRVVLREGDPVDLDNNGLNDDDAFIGVFNNDDAFLTTDRWLYFTADLRDGAGALTGQGMMRVKVCKPDWDGSGVVGSPDIAAFLGDWLVEIASPTGLADYAPDGVINSNDISVFIAEWLAAVTNGC